MSLKYEDLYPFGLFDELIEDIRKHPERFNGDNTKWQFNAGDLVTAPPNPTVFTVKTRWHEMDVYEVVDSRNGFTYFIKSDELKAHRSGNCECGKEKFGFGGHTTWCPLFKENFK